MVLGDPLLAPGERASLWFRRMAGERRDGNVRVDADGVRTRQLSGVRAGTWLVLLAIAALSVFIVVAFRSSAPPERNRDAAKVDPLPPDAPDRGRAPAPPPGPAREARRVPAVVPPDPPRPITPPAAAAKGDAVEPAAGDDAVFGDPNPGAPSGIALFPPMGTKPIKRGLVVPDDFALPPGYVRHHQVTDDGEDVPPILMFHPDYQPVDEHGHPIALPADRVVPPEMAPPGMPIQMLDLPEDQGAPDATP